MKRVAIPMTIATIETAMISGRTEPSRWSSSVLDSDSRMDPQSTPEGARARSSGSSAVAGRFTTLNPFLNVKVT